MNSKDLLSITIVLLLAVLVAEGTVLISTDTDDNQYDTFREQVEILNQKGGKVYFVNGNYNEFRGGQDIVSVEGNTVVFKAHDNYKKMVCPINGIAYFTINSR